MLSRGHHQEGLSRAYIQAVASHCGMSCSFRDFDYGIDTTVNHLKIRAGRRVESGYRLDVQTKSTTRAIIGMSDVTYDLEVKAYNDLRDSEAIVPRILVLLVLPEEEVEWLSINEDALLLRRCAYWLNLFGKPATTNEDRIRVFIPRTNVFTPVTLAEIMQRIRSGGQP